MEDNEELKSPKYKQWVRGAKGLEYLQEGLKGFVSDRVIIQRDKVLQSVVTSLMPVSAVSCTSCTSENLLPEHAVSNNPCNVHTCIQQKSRNCFGSNPKGRRACPNRICGKLYDKIIEAHTFKDPLWKNTDPSKWCTDPVGWSFAKCFQTTPNPGNSSSETDAAGLLDIILNDTYFHGDVDCIQTFTSARGIIEDLLHSAKMELEVADLQNYMAIFIAVLKDKKCLLHYQEAIYSVEELKKLRNNQIRISLSEEINLMQIRKDALIALDQIAKEEREARKKNEENKQLGLKKIEEAKKQEILTEIEGAKANTVKVVHKRIEGSGLQYKQQEIHGEINGAGSVMQNVMPDILTEIVLPRSDTLSKIETAKSETSETINAYDVHNRLQSTLKRIEQLTAEVQQLKMKPSSQRAEIGVRGPSDSIYTTTVPERQRRPGLFHRLFSFLSGRMLRKESTTDQAVFIEESETELIAKESTTDQAVLIEESETERIVKATTVPERQRRPGLFLRLFSCLSGRMLRKERTTDQEVLIEESETELIAKEFKRKLINHYKSFNRSLTEKDSFKNLREKIDIQLLPKLERKGEEKDSDSSNIRESQSLGSWVESLFSVTEANNTLILVEGEPDVMRQSYVDILNTWIYSTDSNIVESKEALAFVLYIKNVPNQNLSDDFNGFVLNYLAKTLRLPVEHCRRVISFYGKCLVLLDDILPTTLSAGIDGNQYYVICCKTSGTDQLPVVSMGQGLNLYVTNGSRHITISLKDGCVLTRKYGENLQEWMNNYLADRCSIKSLHTICFESIKANNEIVSINLTKTSNIETVLLSNCSSSFVVTSMASTLLLSGMSEPTIGKCLKDFVNLKTLCLSFEHENISSQIIETILSSVDICKYLQNIKLKELQIGNKRIDVCFRRSTIQNIKRCENTKTTRSLCSALFGPDLVRFNFHKSDFDSEKSMLTKEIILDAICHKMVSENRRIFEAFACEDRLHNRSEILIACLTRYVEDSRKPQCHCFAGFPVLYKHHLSISTESVVAEADKKGIEYNIKDYRTELSRTIMFHRDGLFINHRNLEAVCGSLVISSKSGIKKSEPCIVLFCRWKGMVPYGETEFPKKLKDPESDMTFPTDIREGFFAFGPYTSHLTEGASTWKQELAMGCSIGAENGEYSATLGPFLHILGGNETCFLTVRHLFQPFSLSDEDLRGTKIVQPAVSDTLVDKTGTSNNTAVCGEVLVSHFSETVDAAVVKIYSSRMPTRGNFVSITKGALKFTGFSESDLPTFDQGNWLDVTKNIEKDLKTDRVIKIGKASGLTRGTINFKDIAVKIRDEVKLSIDHNGMLDHKVMKHQLKVERYENSHFFIPGDSGSAVFLVNEGNELYCIGMAIGFLTDLSCVVTPITNILETLKNVSPHEEAFELKTFSFEEMDSEEV